MIKTVYLSVRPDGFKLYRTYSEAGMKIQKEGTNKVYDEAIDIENSGYTYTETDIPIESDGDLTVEDTLRMLGELGVDVNDN